MTDKATVWADRITAWQASGQSRAAFCRAQGLNANTFDYWRRRLPGSKGAAKPTARRDRSRRAGALVPVAVAGPAPAPVELVLPGGLALRVALDADPTRVAALVRALAAC